jgi:HlyD family secretion protein
LLVYWMLDAPSGKALSVATDRIAISTVKSGIFEDFIPIRGRVTPAKTVYLDAVEGGRVERILVEDGASMKAGDLIVELSNASLQLSVLGNEARVAEQLNNMRSIELNLEQNRLEHKRNLVDIRYQIKLRTRQVSREQELVKTGAVSQSTFDDTHDTLDWYKSRLALTLESQQSDARMQTEQLVFLKDTTKRLEGNLAISRQNLDNMNVKAPVDGTLSGFNIEVGQSIGRGERLGQIDTPNDFKVTAFIDEFYLGRVDIGQQATYENYAMVVSKVYPQVQNGQFEVDFKFTDAQPANIRRGQTIQTKLTLGDASEALLIPNGAFYQDTGGNWIFVVTQDGKQAIRRTVRLGRRNSRFIEVIEGLEVGEKVVTSPYTSYQDMALLKLN